MARRRILQRASVVSFSMLTSKLTQPCRERALFAGRWMGLERASNYRAGTGWVQRLVIRNQRGIHGGVLIHAMGLRSWLELNRPTSERVAGRWMMPGRGWKAPVELYGSFRGSLTGQRFGRAIGAEECCAEHLAARVDHPKKSGGSLRWITFKLTRRCRE